MIKLPYGVIRLGSLSCTLLRQNGLSNPISKRSFKTAAKNKSIKKMSRTKFVSKVRQFKIDFILKYRFINWR